MQSFRRYVREGFAKPDNDLKSESGYLYHATNLENAADIAREGLKPFRPDYGTDQNCWPDGTSRPRVYFSAKAHVVWMFAPTEGRAVVLRVKRTAGTFKQELGTGDIYSETKVPASALEILKDDGTWVKLTPAALQEATFLRPGLLLEGLKDYVTAVAKMSEAMMKEKGYRHPAKLLRDHGRVYRINPTLTYAGPRGTKHQCYANAGRLALDDLDVTYVEGYISVHGVPVSHAWVVTRDGLVLDPTLKDNTGITEYFGVPVKTSYLRKTILRTRMWGLLDAMTNPDILTDDVSAIVQR